MAVLLIAGFMNLIDVTIVNVALPSLQVAFDATSSEIEWVVAAYILTFALGLLPAGRLGDVYGRRRLFLAGIATFTLGSLACGVAGSIDALVASRVLQAIGGAMMVPQTLAIVPVLFAPHERGAPFALFGLTAGFATVTGPVLGGFLIGHDILGLGWRPIFLVNIPVGILAVLAALRWVPGGSGTRGLGIDWVGVALAALTLLALVFPLIEGRQLGWPAWCFALMACALPAGAAFVAWQHRQAARDAPQLLPVALLGNRGYLVGTGMVMVLFSGIPGFFFVIALYLQNGYGLTPLQSGLTTLPFSVGILIASIAAIALGDRAKRARMGVGAALLCGAMIWLELTVRAVPDEIGRTLLLAPLLVGGLGLGTTVSPLFQTVLANVGGRDTGAASGALQALQQVGGALGIAVMGEIFFSALASAENVAPHVNYSNALFAAVLWNVAAFTAVGLGAWRRPVVNRTAA